MFKETFKYYKSKWPVPDFSEVYDFDSSPPLKGVKELPLSKQCTSIPQGVKPFHQWKVFELTDRQGLIFIKNPFTAHGQRYWIARCLRDYPKNPNVKNLSANTFKSDVLNDWWSSLQNTTDKDFRKKLKYSMRWTTLGYHHDWDTKIYSEKNKNKFPHDLAALSGFFAEVLGFEKYSAEAAIVNYYPIGTTLAGHTDHSEVDLEAPLYSFSFGQTAIFLIGGKTKDEKPSALFLKSGDIVVMSKFSRLCYHAVPRIIKTDNESWDQLNNLEIFNISEKVNEDSPPETKRIKRESNEDTFKMNLELWTKCSDDKFWCPFNNYLEDCRININVRQVLKEGQTSL